MTFDAKNIDGYLEDPETLRFLFNVVSAVEMKGFGAALSTVVRAMQDKSREMQKEMRIGISAYPNSGKSTLIKGILEEFMAKKSVERTFIIQTQNTWKCPETGHIRSYDSLVMHMLRLKSYAHNNSSQFGFPFIDIVEHPEYDVHNTQFDCLIKIIKSQNTRMAHELFLEATRGITVAVTPDMSNSIAFSNFLKLADQYRVPEQDNIPLKQRNASNGFIAAKPF